MSHQNPGKEFVRLVKEIKERLLKYCSPRLKKISEKYCLRLYNDMKIFFYRIKQEDDPEYRRIYVLNLIPIMQFILMKRERNTFKTYFKILWHYTKFLIRNKIYIYKVDYDVLNSYFSRLEAEYKSVNTLHLINNILKAFYNQYGKKNIVDMLRKIRFKRRMKFKVDLTDEEYERIYQNTDDYRVKLALELISGSGLRPGEALGIAWGDIDIKSSPWRVHIRYIPNSPYGAKGEGGERKVPITDRAAKLINFLRKIYIEKYVSDPMQVDKYSRIINISYRTLDRKFKKAVKKAGIRKRYPLTLHKLRHYFAHRWMRNIKNITQLKEILGHSNIQYTMVYANPAEEEILNNFKKINRK